MITCDHDGAMCREQNPHIPARTILGPDEEQITLPGHRHCEWCRYCKDCHPHLCYHDGEPCARCGTSVKDRPVPVLGDPTGMCQPPPGVPPATDLIAG